MKRGDKVSDTCTMTWEPSNSMVRNCRRGASRKNDFCAAIFRDDCGSLLGVGHTKSPYAQLDSEVDLDMDFAFDSALEFSNTHVSKY